jgi:proline iminopeptidase
LYPATEPYESGHLDTGDGNRVYWEVSGNPVGRPVVGLHGGPGSGCTPAMRRFFDPDAYRIVLFDQRGCGRSTPHASDPTVDLATNTTDHLLSDLELLRRAHGIDAWAVFGNSWGSTLGLAYAQRHRDRVTGVVLAAVTVGRRDEIDWLYRGGLARFFPEAWARFRAGVAATERDGDLVEAYHGLLEDPDAEGRAAAARRWTDWDWSTASIDTTTPLPPRWADPPFQLARARICTHYFRNNAFLEDGALLRGAPALAGIPARLVNGRFDLGGPLVNAWDLAHAWPGSELVVVGGAGHSTADPGMDAAIVAATDQLARSR